MVKGTNVQSDMFSALADPTRRAILRRLAGRSATAGELAKPFKTSLPAISKHLRILEQAGMIERRVEGRVHHLSLRAERLREVAEWIEECRGFWTNRLAALKEYLENTPPAPPLKQGGEVEALKQGDEVLSSKQGGEVLSSKQGGEGYDDEEAILIPPSYERSDA